MYMSLPPYYGQVLQQDLHFGSRGNNITLLNIAFTFLGTVQLVMNIYLSDND